MSDRTNEGQERFSIDDIIAEVRAGQNDGGEEAGGPDLLIPQARPDSRAEGPAEPRRLHHDAQPEQEAPEKDEVRGEDKAPGRRVILFRSRGRRGPDSGADGEPEAAEREERPEREEAGAARAGEEQFVPYPVSDDDEEYYIEEEPYEEEEEAGDLPYDFLNVAFDDPSRGVKRLGRKLVAMSMRLVFLVLLLAGAGYLTFGAALGLPGLPAVAGVAPELLQDVLLAGGVFLALLLAWEVTTAGLWRLLRLRPTLDSLTVFSALCCLLHCVFLALGLSEGQPLAFVAILCCFFALAGKRSRAMTLRRTYKCMEMAADPTAVKAVGGKRYRAAVKTHSRAYAETDDAAAQDMVERTSCVFAPVAIVAAVVLAAVASFGRGDGGRFVWSLAVISSVLAPCALCVASTGPWARVARRLFASGAAILDTPAAGRLARVRHAALLDGDVFPLGAVHIAGMKITSNTIKMEQVVADAAAVMKEVGGGVGKAFGDFAREQYLVPRRALNVRYFEGGGIAAQVQSDYVLMGSAEFLQKMGVMVHEGSDKKNAVFVSVNSYMAAIFTLKYTVQPQPYTAFGILGRCGITADLALRDFSVSEKLVEDRFAVRHGRAQIPELRVREAYWNENLADDQPVCAILARDSVLAFAEVLAGARALVRSVRLNLFCGYACSVIGMITMYFLAAMDKIYLASPGNIALYLLIWLVPVRFASIFMTRF